MSTYQPWSFPSKNIKVSADNVHVWRASLEMPDLIVQHLIHVLSTEEMAKARSFRFEKHRLHWIVARGLLRTLLGWYLEEDPQQLCFRYNSYGKPSLESPISDIQFNISHSRDLALYAFSFSRQIGVDVEYMRSDFDYEDLAKYSFSPFEREELRAVPVEAKRQAFFNGWTRKEAYIKARGKGVSIPLDQFDVVLKPGEPATLMSSREDPRETQRWSFYALDPGTDYAGALVVEGFGVHISYWQLETIFPNH
ncbi:MAG: 4'-phosphopantetheinyl transferase superfamily protein [Ktedonobacteraceae bacterium]